VCSSDLIHLPSPLSIGLHGSSQLNLAQFWQALANYAADSLITTPALAAAILQGVANGALNASQFGFIAVGGAAVPAQLLTQAEAIGLPIYQGYGLSECGSVVTLNTPAANRPGTVGKALPGLTLHLHDGELHVRGKAMDGYLGAEAPPSIIATGDLANCDDDGFITIYGRKSNLLITSFGRNISPEWPESLAAHSAYWSQFMVCGDGYPSLVAILTPQAESSPAAIDNAITQLNQQLPDYAQITAWIATNEPFSQENQQLTFNNRFRRGHIVGAYRNQLDAIFGG
jgi:long-subunit acyl-CoA synthetase (AMP-forming)